MARRPNPDRVYEAKRAGTVARLRDRHRITGDQAEQLVHRWELVAPTRGLDRHDSGFWHEAERWFAEQQGST